LSFCTVNIRTKAEEKAKAEAEAEAEEAKGAKEAKWFCM